MRNPSAIDYSEPIFDWLQNNKEEALKKWECIISGDLQQKQKAIMGDATVLKVPNFKAVNMHQTRFSDLKFRLGAGYLYCHQVHFCCNTFLLLIDKECHTFLLLIDKKKKHYLILNQTKYLIFYILYLIYIFSLIIFTEDFFPMIYLFI